MVTCGLDHVGGPEEVEAESYNYPRKARIRHTLHGRVTALPALPARLVGHGERWEGERCVLWTEGVVAQATNFGENLHLYRRIEADLGATRSG